MSASHYTGRLQAAWAVLVVCAVSLSLHAQSADQLQRLSLSYEGSFRVPEGGTGTASTFEFGGSALAFDAQRRSLWLVGHDQFQRVAEISVPDVRAAGTIDSLARGNLLTPFRDALQGRRAQVGDPDSKIGGLLQDGPDWIFSAWIYYDASNVQSRSHFRVSANGSVTGPFQLGDEPREAGFVSGYMTTIPPEWRSRFGGDALAGQCCIPIISRTSLGPSAAVFTASHVGTRSDIPLQHVLGYPLDHPTLGKWEDDGGGLFNGNTQIGGVVFPRGTSTVLFFGRVGLGDFCYGTGTANRALEGQLVPGGGGARYCYDPTGFDQGTHGYPYALHVWAYDANELVAVRNGEKNPWDVRPYAAGVFTLPFERGMKAVGGAAFDEATGRIFISVPLQDSTLPLIHVLRLGALPDPPPVTDPPAPQQPSTPSTPTATGPSRPTNSGPVGRAVPR